MQQDSGSIDFQKALRDPSAVFQSPHDVVQRVELSREKKIEVLRRWEFDALELQVAEEENMPSTQESALDEVLAALRELGANPDTEHSPPTKSGGV